MGDNVTGIVLDIPQSVLQSIKNADKEIKNLEATSRQAAQKIKDHFDNTMVSGVNAFIKKLQQAQGVLGNLKMPRIDATGLSASIQALSQAMGTLDKSATTGSNRLGRIADAVTKLQTANPDPQIFQNIADGIERIGNTSQQTIANVTQLAMVMAQLARDIRTVQQAQQEQNAGTATAAQYNKLYKEQAALVQQMNEIQAKGRNATSDELALLDKMKARYHEIYDQLDKLNGKKQTAASELANLRGYQRVSQVQNISTPQGAIDYAKSAKSLNDLQAAYKNLKVVMRNLDPKSRQWRELNKILEQTGAKIDRVKGKMGEFRSHASSTGTSIGRLGGMLATAFSLSAITGYINKMVEVRAQFELQNVALRAILQNKEQADRIFSQVQRMALQSPFTIMQLTAYTKQLAAYRVEANKLVGTTKMLADVSAGLGVDMQRLILAYGQVKSANYLRATEVRQFTEAGLNITGELSQYFTELQGRMISVGDVMEMISKRMVRFEDVEEVFRRVTSEGGIFYNMQMKQSETLYGQMQRIKDAMSIMFNEIGKSNQNLISRVLTLIRSLLKHWREVAAAIEIAGVALLAFWLRAKLFPKIAIYVKVIGAAMKALTLQTKALNAAILKFGRATVWGIIASAVAAVVMVVYEALTATSALEDEFRQIEEELQTDYMEAVSNFYKLANAALDTTKTLSEQEEAIKSLKRAYGDMIDEHQLTAEYLRSLNGDYTELTEKVKEYYRAQEYEKKRDAVMNSEPFEDLKSRIWLAIDKLNESDILGYSLPKGLRGAIADQLARAVVDGTVQGTREGIWQAMKQVLNIPTAPDDFRMEGETSKTAKAMRLIGYALAGAEEKAKELDGALMSIVTTTGELKNVQKELTEQDARAGGTPPTWDEDGAKVYWAVYAKDAVAQMKEEYDWAEKELIKLHDNADKGNLNEAVTAYVNALKGKGYTEIAETQIKNLLQDAKTTYELLENFQTTFANGMLSNFIEKFYGEKIDWEEFERLKGGAWDTTDEVIKHLGSLTISSNYANTGLIAADTFVDNFAKGVASQMPAAFSDSLSSVSINLPFEKLANKVTSALSRVSVQSKAASKEMDKLYSDRAIINAERFGANINDINRILRQGADTPREMAKQLRNEAKRLQELVDAYNTTANKTVFTFANGISADDIETYEKTIKALEELAKELFGGDEQNNHNRHEDAQLKKWRELKKLIEEVSKSYEQYRAKYSTREANAMIEKQYGKLFKELGVDIKDFYKNGKYDAEELAKALEKLKSMVNATTTERKNFKSELSRGIESVEVDVKLKAREEELNQFKEDINSLFDSYELTKTLKDLDVNVDLVYMVGGKPTTLEDVREQLGLQKAVIDGKEGAEDEYKAIIEAEKKLTNIEFKEQQQRLENYEKYLKQMYSDRAKTMIASFTLAQQAEADFQKNIQKLEEKRDSDDTSDEEKVKIEKAIRTLRAQHQEVLLGISKDYQAAMAKADWEGFKGSEIFVSMYQDVNALTKKGIDALITRLEDMRTKLQSLANVDPKAVKEITQHIEKLKDAKINLAPYTGFKEALKEAKSLKKDYGSIEDAQVKLIELNDEVLGHKQKVADLETIIGLLDKGVDITGKTNEETERLNNLYEENKSNLQQALTDERNKLDISQKNADLLGARVAKAKSLISAYEKQIQVMQKYKEYTEQITDSVFEIADALGGSVDEAWKNLASSIINAVFQGIQLQMQMEILKVEAQLLGVEMNSALGVIGWIATALSVVANLFTAIFASKDKRLQKQIDALQDKVDSLSKAFEKLQESIEKALSVSDENNLTEQALDNLNQRKQYYQEMLALEEQKKKKDEDAIDEYKEKLEELAEAEKELYETRHEKWGSTNSAWDEANEWVDAWLDAYEESGDGLDALNDSWDDFYKNLIKKQAASAVFKNRMDKWVDEINAAIDKKNIGEYGYIDLFKNIGERMKAEFSDLNEDLKAIFDYAGIGSSGELLLSDLQKGIQNITEDQAAAIEAYLNSMRFAVFEQNSILTKMLNAIQEQYDQNNENTMLKEVKAIRALVASIDDRLSRVIVPKTASAGNYIVKIS